MTASQLPPRYLTPGEDALLRTHYPNTRSAALQVTINGAQVAGGSPEIERL